MKTLACICFGCSWSESFKTGVAQHGVKREAVVYTLKKQVMANCKTCGSIAVQITQ